MKQLFKEYILLFGAILCIAMVSCSSDDENDEIQNNILLIGSQWERSYYWIDDDDLSWEKGKCVLEFTGSNLAQETVTYNGMGYKYNYDLDLNEFKSYSGTNTNLYTYEVCDNQIILHNESDGATITAVLSGNKLQTSEYEWTLVKEGDNNGEVNDNTESYSWTNMQGVWMEDYYEAYADDIQMCKSQNLNSEAYLNNIYNGNFQVFGVQFNKDGQIREVNAQIKAFHNTDALIFETIYTSDGKILYWTDVSGDSYGDNYIIRGDKIYTNGKVAFSIINSNMIVDNADCVYVRVK